MLIVVWSPKGGSGTSVVAVTIAECVARVGGDVRLVDLSGDVPAICGQRIEPALGFSDLLASRNAVDHSLFDAVTIEISQRFRLIVSGTVSFETMGLHDVDRADRVVQAMARSNTMFVVDAATLINPAARSLVIGSQCSLVVMRPCFLSMTRACAVNELVAMSAGIVFVDEPHRSLGIADVVSIVGRPVVARVPLLPEIARSVDAGLLLRRFPQQLFQPISNMCGELHLFLREVNVGVYN